MITKIILVKKELANIVGSFFLHFYLIIYLIDFVLRAFNCKMIFFIILTIKVYLKP